jgi:hypothetical protein
VASASAGGAGASPWRPVERRGAGGLEDGFDFLTHAADRPLDAAGTRLVLGARGVDDTAPDTTTVAVHASAGALLWRAVAPGAPGHRPGEMCAVRVAGDAGAITAVWDLGGLGDVEWSAPGDALTVILRSGGTDRHHPPGRDDVAWRIRVERPGAPPNDVRLPAFEPSEPSAPSGASMRPRPARAATTRALDPAGAPLVFALGEAHYHRTEDDWAAAGRPTAHVTLRIRDDRLHVTAAVRLGRAPVFVPPGTDNPLDNERSGVNGDGLQLHLGLATADDGVEPMGAWLLVPVAPGEGVDVVPTAMPDPAAAAAAPAADWAATPGGWTLDAAVPLAPLRARAAEVGAAPVVALALLVNEMPAGRERRRGQLVLDGAEGGGGGAFIYLRGDRYDPARGLRLRLPPAP